MNLRQRLARLERRHSTSAAQLPRATGMVLFYSPGEPPPELTPRQRQHVASGAVSFWMPRNGREGQA
jgi:hypothetical protein